MIDFCKHSPDIAKVTKDLQLYGVPLREFLTYKYAIWLDLRTSDDDQLHGRARRIENASEGINIKITKDADGKAEINGNLYLFIGGQSNIKNYRFKNAIYQYIE